ncbi:Asp-tRNA(Asn)/Glu-tRNA(Gln) amidotransferase subunit GatB [Bdellovibrionota bacterium]
MSYEAVIGLEVHAQLLSKTKLFCGCSTEFKVPPNENICPVCTGLPGVLPSLNKEVLRFTTMMALATNCKINTTSQFARKNYFYPDLPKGYQISQYDRPIAEHGWINIQVNENEKKIGITRIHMEEDAGKSIHRKSGSALNFNRASVPLIEIVSEPDLRSPAEAGAYMRKLRDILVYLGICDGNMEEGSIRCDANVSIRKQGETTLGTKTEVKNLNSFRYVERALKFEIERQIGLVEDGKKISQETLLWDEGTSKTVVMRTKESAHDYRYFPDPDLLPAVVEQSWIEEIKGELPELPDEKRQRFMENYKLSPYDTGVLTSSRELADYYEACVAMTKAYKLASNWITVELLGKLNEKGLEIVASPIKPGQIAELVDLIEDKTISGNIAKVVFEEMFSTGKDPSKIVDEKGLKQITDSSEIDGIIDRILEENPKQVEQYKAGKTKVFGFFVGQAMKATQGKANPEVVNKILKSKLQS